MTATNAHPDLPVCDVMPNPRLARKDDFVSVQHEDDLTLGRMAVVAILPSAFRSTSIRQPRSIEKSDSHYKLPCQPLQ